MQDSFHRTIEYLRVSVTDRCNLRCVYCMPPEGVEALHHSQILSYEEIDRIVRAAARLGMRKVRVTGGEPLVRLGITDLVRMFAEIPGIEEISMTTNGVLLARYAHDLAEAGLHRVNVSLDTLHRDRFEEITGRDHLADVLEGIEAAEQAGLVPVKVNVVAMRGVNGDEMVDFARLTLDRAWCVRFIERMPTVGPEERDPHYLAADEILEQIGQLGNLEPAASVVGNGPARYYRYPNAPGTIGVITPMSHAFCDTCNRLRLTSEGLLRLCLFGDEEVDLRTPLRAGASVEDLMALIQDALTRKPRRHQLDERARECKSPRMSRVGG